MGKTATSKMYGSGMARYGYPRRRREKAEDEAAGQAKAGF